MQAKYGAVIEVIGGDDGIEMVESGSFFKCSQRHRIHATSQALLSESAIFYKAIVCYWFEPELYSLGRWYRICSLMLSTRQASADERSKM